MTILLEIRLPVPVEPGRFSRPNPAKGHFLISYFEHDRLPFPGPSRQVVPEPGTKTQHP